MLLVDALVSCLGAKQNVQELADLLKFGTFCAPMGKSIIDETREYFYGVYGGSISQPGVQDAVENESDLVLHLGPLLGDSNTGSFSNNVYAVKAIYVDEKSVKVMGKEFFDVPLKSCKLSLLFSVLYVLIRASHLGITRNY